MAISANSIIHYTETFEAVKSILREKGFRVSYAIEKVVTRGVQVFSYAIPMVSFCDIPLADYKKHFYKPQLKNSLGYYGDYGIGLKKSWAVDKGLNPVLYIEKNSLVGLTLNHAVKEIEKVVKSIEAPVNNNSRSKITGKEAILTEIEHLPCFVKNYQGVLERRNKPKVQAYRFYDEREWRYVPIRENIVKEQLFVKSEIYENDVNMYKNSLRGITLNFDYNDLSYVILRNEDEVNDLIEFLNYEVGDKKMSFVNKVLTSQQIITDF